MVVPMAVSLVNLKAACWAHLSVGLLVVKMDCRTVVL